MPCNDITDVITVRLDSLDRLSGYSIIKKSCGGQVGRAALILDWIGNKSAREIIATEADSVLDYFRPKGNLNEFLVIKHFLAVKSTLESFLGLRSASPESYCAVESISYDSDGTDIVACLRSDLMTDEIKACGRCCGSPKSHR